MRFYYEDAKAEEPPTGPTSVPIALAAAKNDFQSIRRFAERDHAAIVSWNVYDEGGHTPPAAGRCGRAEEGRRGATRSE